jgi:UDP-N-acetylmuramate--alanine ligase
VEPLFAGNTDEVMELINNNVKDGDVVLVMGAGNIGEVPGKLMKQGKKEE